MICCQTVRIGVHPERGINRSPEFDIVRAGSDACRLHSRASHRGQIYSLSGHAQLARDDTRDVEEILDEASLELNAAVQHVQATSRGRLIELAGQQHLRPAKHHVERRAKLVREGGQELILRPSGFSRLRGGDLRADKSHPIFLCVPPLEI